MKTISKIEQEVNQIRLNIYEKTKNMTPTQLTEYYRKSGETTAQKYGFKIVASASDNHTQAAQEK
jgi:soluble cytochrome b562